MQVTKHHSSDRDTSVVIFLHWTHTVSRGKPYRASLKGAKLFLLLKKVPLFFSLITGGPTVPIKSKLPPSGTRTPPRVSQKENKSDDKLFEFLNSIPSSKERKPAKPKIFTESSSEVIPKQNETVDLMPNDATDAAFTEG